MLQGVWLISYMTILADLYKTMDNHYNDFINNNIMPWT